MPKNFHFLIVLVIGQIRLHINKDITATDSYK